MCDRERDGCSATIDAFVRKLSNASAVASAPKDDQTWAARIAEGFTPIREQLVCRAARRHSAVSTHALLRLLAISPLHKLSISLTRLMTSRRFWKRMILHACCYC
jgi:hypothetical protein